MKINELVQMAKEALQKFGNHQTMIILEDKKSLKIVGLMFKNAEEKEEIRQGLKEYILKNQIKKYWFVSESWMSKVDKKDNKPYIPPRRDINRKEVIIIEQNEPKKSITYILPFKRKGKDIIFEKVEKNAKCRSSWNFYDDAAEELQKDIKERDRKYFNNLSKKILNKHKSDFEDAYLKKDLDKAIEICKKIKEEMIKEKEKIDKQILEDTDKK